MTKRKAKAKKLPKGITKKQHEVWKRIHKKLEKFLDELQDITMDVDTLMEDEFEDGNPGFKGAYGQLTIVDIALETFIDSMSHINRD